MIFDKLNYSTTKKTLIVVYKYKFECLNMKVDKNVEFDWFIGFAE